MSGDFTHAMRQSAYYLKKYRETLLGILRASEIIPCENEPERVACHLDISCGIDYILVSEDGTFSRGIGCRFQEDRFGEKYRTFTVRKGRDSGAETEFEKRKKAIEKGGLYPYLTLHAYVDRERDRIDRLAVAKTDELIDYCEKRHPPVRHTCYGESGQAEFYVVEWDEYKAAGRDILIREGDEL